MFMLLSIEPIKVADLQELANQMCVEWRTCDRNGKQFFQ